jgi:DNA-binding IscR family transcriptional regulator
MYSREDGKVMENKSLYNEGHLFVSALRVLEHQKGVPPMLDQISALLGIPTEQAGLVSRRLRDAGIVEEVQGAFGGRFVIKDHLKIEDLPREVESSQLGDALKKFQSERDKIARKIETIKEQQAQKQKDLFAEIEKKFKKGVAKD